MNSANFFAQFRANKLAMYWLKNGIFSLVLSGIYLAVFLLFPSKEFSRLTLVVHLTLSTFVWFMSITAATWSYNQQASKFSITCVILSFISVSLIALSPFCRQNFSIINNYVTMLENIMFILGISLFGVSALLFTCYILYNSNFNDRNSFSKLINFTIFSTATLFILVWVCFSLSYYQLKEIIKLTPISIEFYYELLFFSGGHLLQFIYTQIVILIWIILFYDTKREELKFFQLYLILLCLNFIVAILAPCGHLLYNVSNENFRSYYSSLVKYSSVIPICSVALLWYDFIITHQKFPIIKNNSPRIILSCSTILFLAPKFVFVNFLITDPMLTILVHYHIPMLGISLAFMNFSYLIFSSHCEQKFL